MILLASCDTDASASSIKLPKILGAPHFNCLDLRNAMVPLITLRLILMPVPEVSHDPESHVASHIDHFEPGNAMVLLIELSILHDAIWDHGF